ncbi:Peptidyl-prolyl cis-trans isomerase [Melia azedarach]|uniref:Peptidyl-prolyl cis-trans isomerase n=1 Tax=Melia azedarach TaxID=155640 RepID=A0ACC1YG93_MELAZ|nr:Peptidyl-prolyl cis-trans isomerase [Melia azedarach]
MLENSNHETILTANFLNFHLAVITFYHCNHHDIQSPVPLFSSSIPLLFLLCFSRDQPIASNTENIITSCPNPLVSISGLPAERITRELLEDICPQTAENFRALYTVILQGERGVGVTTGKPLYYKGSTFHSIIEGQYAQLCVLLFLQGGDFSHEDGSGGESIYGGKFEDENFDAEHNCEGLLSMANDGKEHTNGSRFFITFKELPHLNGKNVVFGKVVRKLEKVPTDDRRKPNKLVIVTACGELSNSKIRDTIEPKTDLTSSPRQRKKREGDSEHHRAALNPIPLHHIQKRICMSFGESQEKQDTGDQIFSRNTPDEAAILESDRHYSSPDRTKEKRTRRPRYYSPDRTRGRSFSRHTTPLNLGFVNDHQGVCHADTSSFIMLKTNH